MIKSTINLSKLDFKALLNVIGMLYLPSINLSKLDFKGSITRWKNGGIPL